MRYGLGGCPEPKPVLWIYRTTAEPRVRIPYSVDHTSLKKLWQAVANFRRVQREGRYHDERRRESRRPAQGIASVSWEVEGGTWRSQAANLLGISKHGCSFRTAQPLARGQKILIEGGKTLGTIEAVVRHIEPDGHEYIVGAENIARDGKGFEWTATPVISDE